MIKFAIIGTNWITEKFIHGTMQPPQGKNLLMQLSAVYSRDLHKAKDFANNFSVSCIFDDLDKLAKDNTIDAIYIASPNSLHYSQSKLMLEHKKHVICEKPLSSNYQQAKDLYRIAKENNVIFFEAYKTAHLPNFNVIQNNLSKIGTLRKAHIHYCQYSSRYDAYLAGQKPNTFNPEFSNGSIMDIGYYCIAITIALFGAPINIKAQATLLDSGVDGCGSVLLDYERFSVTIDHSKISASDQLSEIQGEKGALLINHIGECSQIFHQSHRDNRMIELSQEQAENSMSYEAIAFVEQIQTGKINKQFEQRSLQTASVINEIRRQTGVFFPDDKSI
ncbi:Gfo/Idh/MocA family protein [Psychromonas algicola]|uniref:Gfo/Idh/MocA family protein n=1 Tax=Psychromonas algicola TaxID=2555642 RepID=UPI001068B2DC|nr:Gfo/Idh/MocA family oxidoreductase [Psychromonas sp. RZ5]TEW52986.1 Gfo/Idh/MocA family oxidoreductase [Psychromonas sp. RZ5]